MSRGQADAKALGCTQTPVLLGHQEGGLTAAPLVKGALFDRHFPDASAVHATPEIESLAPVGIPDDVVAEWSRRMPSGLNELQLDAVNEAGIIRTALKTGSAASSCGARSAP